MELILLEKKTSKADKLELDCVGQDFYKWITTELVKLKRFHSNEEILEWIGLIHRNEELLKSFEKNADILKYIFVLKKINKNELKLILLENNEWNG